MTGLDAALRRLSALPERLEAAALSAADAAAREAVQAARSLVPVRTGALRASIRVQPLSNGASAEAAQPYAFLVEAGSTRVPARPYLLPAARLADYPRRAARACQEVLK